MTSSRGIIESWWRELPRPTAARWAALFFSLHVLTLQISVAASEASLAAAALAYLIYLLRLRSALGGAGLRAAICFPPVKLPLLLFCLATFSSILWAAQPAVGGFALRKLVLFLILLLSVNLVASTRHLEALFRALFFVSALAGLVAAAQFVIQYHNVRQLHHDRVYFYMTLTRNHGFMGHWMNFGGQQMLIFCALLAFLLLPHGVIRSADLMSLRRTTLHQNARSALECGSEAAALNAAQKAVANATALQGAFGTGVFTAARNLPLLWGGWRRRDQSKIPRGVYPERTAEILLPRLRDQNDRLTVQRGKGPRLYWLLMAIVATSLVLNFTRGVWLGCVVATVYVVARWKPRTLWVIPLLLLVAYLAAPSLIRRRVSLAFHPKDDPALASRLEMWAVGLRMIRAHPWVGVGPGNIPLVYTQYLPPGTTPMIGYRDHLHDNFLQLAAERGLPCLIAWLWFMLALGWNVLRIRQRLSSQRWVAAAAFAGWLAFLAEGFFEFNFGTSPVLMVFLFVMSTPFVADQCESRAQESNTPALVEQPGAAATIADC